MTNIQTELNAIKFLMTKRNPELLVRLDVSLFGNELLAKIFMLVKRFYIENSVVMGWDVLRSKVVEKCDSPDRLKAIMILLDQIQERDIEGLTDDLLIGEMRDLGKCRVVLGRLEDITRAAEQRDTSAVLGHFRQAYEAITIEDSQHEDEADLASLAGKDIQFNFHKTGFPPLDKRGGLIEGGVTIVGGEAKQGKSNFTKQVAIYNFEEYQDTVALFSYEQGKQEQRARILSEKADIDVGRIMSKQITLEEQIALRYAEAKLLLRPYDDLPAFCEASRSMSNTEFFEVLFNTYTLKDNRFLIYDDPLNWDDLFVKMELVHSTKGVTFFIIDYPYLVPRGFSDRGLANWEYNLTQSKKLKHFARKHGVRIMTPAQYDSKEDTLRYVKGVINDCDLFLAISQSKDDEALGQVTVSYKAYRNFFSIPGEPFLTPFKLVKELNKSRFVYMEF